MSTFVCILNNFGSEFDSVVFLIMSKISGLIFADLVYFYDASV